MRYEPTLQPILRTSAFQVAFRIRCNLEKALYLSAGVLRTASAVGNVPWNRTLSYLASMLTVVKLHSITGAASAVDAFRRNIRFVQPGPFFRGFSSEVIVVAGHAPQSSPQYAIIFILFPFSVIMKLQEETTIGSSCSPPEAYGSEKCFQLSPAGSAEFIVLCKNRYEVISSIRPRFPYNEIITVETVGFRLF